MSPFNPDKFRLDSTSQGGVNSSIDRKIEKLSKKCAELIQKNRHKDAKKILSEIKELKSLRLPEDEIASNHDLDDLEKTVVTTPLLQSPHLNNDYQELEKTLATTPLSLENQEKTVVSPLQEIQQIPPDLDKTVVTTPFNPEQITIDQNQQQQSVQQQQQQQKPQQNPSTPQQNPRLPDSSQVQESQETLPIQKSDTKKSTIFGIGACVAAFFVMAFFSFLAFKDFPGRGNYFDWLRAESVYQKAESERNQGSFDSAIANYIEANKIYPELAKAADARGQIQLIKGQTKEALASFKDAAQNNSKNSKFQRDYANALRLNDEEVKAVEIVTMLDTKEPGAPQNKALLALLQLKLNQVEADTTLAKALSNTNDSNFERDYYAGIYYQTKEDLPNSLTCFKRANKAEPMNVLGLLELIKAKTLNKEDSTQEASDLTKVAGNWVESWHANAVQNELQKKYSEAAESYARACKLDSGNSERFSRAAKAYLEAGNNTNAIKFAQDGLKLNASNFNCLDIISEADEHADPSKMEELYQNALKEVPDSAPGWSGLASWQSKDQGKTLEALESQAKAVKLDPKDALMWYQLAIYLDSCGNTKEAIRAAAEAMSLEPENEKYTELRMNLLSND